MKCPVCLGEQRLCEDYGSAGVYWQDCYCCNGSGKKSFGYMVNCWLFDHIPVRLIEWWDKHIHGTGRTE